MFTKLACVIREKIYVGTFLAVRAGSFHAYDVKPLIE